MIFDNNIQNVINDKKSYYLPIINGELEIETINFFKNKKFVYLTMPELNQQLFTKERFYSFKRNDQIIELNSSQAMKISAASALYGKVFTLSKCFRNEKFCDNIHLSEFKVLELEFPVQNEEDLFDLINEYLNHIISWFNNYLLLNNLNDIFEPKKIDFPIERKEYESVVQEYSQKGVNLVFVNFYFCDMDITDTLKKPLLITSYPSIGSWRALKKDSKHSYLNNLILPYGFGELIECSIRDSKYETYKQKFDELGYSEYYQWYLNALKNVKNMRAGLGMGIERLGSWLMDLKDIGKQLLFPIYPKP